MHLHQPGRFNGHFFNRAWSAPAGDIAANVIKLADSNRGSISARGLVKGLTGEDKTRLREGVEICTEVLVRYGASAERVFLGNPPILTIIALAKRVSKVVE